MSDYEYLITVKKLDEIFEEKQRKNFNDLLSNKEEINSEEKNYLNEMKDNRIIEKISREDDLYQEIYGKFNGNYSELVEDYVQTLVKFENKKVKRAYFFGSIFCIVSLSLAVLFSNLIPI